MRIGIITFHRACNCGAMLQAYALQSVLRDMGHEVSFPNCNAVGYCPTIPYFHSTYHGPRRVISYLGWLKKVFWGVACGATRAARHNAFARRYLRTDNVNSRSLDLHYDLLVYGSDQIWNVQMGTALFFGETASTCRKISYAASIGDQPLPEEGYCRLKNAAAKFDALSVRDPMSGSGLVDAHGRQAEVVLDPTFLLGSERWQELASVSRTNGGGILAYTARAEEFIRTCGAHASKRLGLPVRHLSMYGEDAPFGPREFVAAFRDCSAVLANSFHAMAFALIFHKPFVVVRDQVDSVDSRQMSLMRDLGIEGRLVNPGTIADDWLGRLTEPLLKSSYEKLEAEKSSSLAWLKGVVERV